MIITLMIFLVSMIALIIIILASILSKKSLNDREKLSPFECGFDPFSSSRIPFSLRFFMVAIIFLIFDVEIAIILPIPLSIISSDITMWFLIFSVFIITLIVGLFHEWNFGSLDWSK